MCVGLKFLVAKAFWPVSLADETEFQSKAVASERCKYLPRDKYAQLKFDLIHTHTHTHTLGNTHTRAGVCSPIHSPIKHSHPFGNKMAAKEAASTIPKKKRNSLTPQKVR